MVIETPILIMLAVLAIGAIGWWALSLTNP
jgi:hypothetical protein